MAEGAPLLHPDLENYTRGGFNIVPGTNILVDYTYSLGDMAAGFAAADEIFEDEFYAHAVAHVPMETHAAAAQYSNVYLETSGGQVSDIEIAVELLGEDRIVFGTDLPIGGAAAGKWNVHKINAARISDRAKERILGQNILEILGRVTRTGGASQ